MPLSTDLYLPALPGMGAHFNATPDRINLTLTAFMIFYALGTLVWGPLSDHFGRKPILIAGLTLYVISSTLCALTPNVDGLILSRIFQALGGSAAGVVATAIVKDVYSGKKRGSVLAIVQSMVLISPAIAPVIGALLLKFISWRGVFWSLTGIGVVALAGSLMFQETIAERTNEMLLPSLGRLGKVLQNRGFTLLLLLFSLGAMSTFAYIGSSTYIYQNDFHLIRSGLQLLFLVKRAGYDRRTDDLFVVFAARAHREDHSRLLCFHPHQRAAGFLFGEQGAMGICAMHPAGFDRRQLHPPGLGEYDAGAAEGGHGFGLLVDGLHRFADGQPGAAVDLDALEQHHHRAGGDDLFDRRHSPHRLAVRDQKGCAAAGTERVTPAENRFGRSE